MGETFGYEIPVEDGTYTLKLHFAEIYWQKAGKRVFSVDIENGQGGLVDYDIYADVGKDAATIKTFEAIDITDGALSVNFTTSKDNAKISAIEVLTESTTPEAILAASPATLDFGSQDVGTTTTDLVTIDNSGALDATAVDVSLTGSEASEFSFVSSCDATIAAGGQCTVEVNFQPTMGGTASAELEIGYQSDGTAKTLSVALSGEGVVPEYSLTTTVDGNGTVSRSPDQQTYPSGTDVTLTATSETGWVFTGWSGDVSSTSNPISVSITENTSILASFVELPTTEAFTSIVTVTDSASHTQSLTWGTDASATDGFDAGLDHRAPPPPPPGAFDARLTGSAAGDLYADIRPPSTAPGQIQWTLELQADGTHPLHLNWDPTLLPAGDFTLTGTVSGTAVSTNLKSQSEVAIAPSSGELVTLQLTMNVPDPASITTYGQSLFADWSFAGLPLDVGFGDVNLHYPGVEAESVFGFDGSYYTAGRMQLGQAYWLLSAEATTQNINGYSASEVALSLKAGWNAVSGPSCDVPLPLGTTADPDGIVNTIKTFNGGGLRRRHRRHSSRTRILGTCERKRHGFS